jgi:hypothetical protein
MFCTQSILVGFPIKRNALKRSFHCLCFEFVLMCFGFESELCGFEKNDLIGLNTLDLRFNAFNQELGNLWQCLPLQNLQVLYLGNNSFHSTLFQVDFEKYTHLVLLDVSSNQLGGQLIFHGYDQLDIIFDSRNNSFTCPMPPVSSNQFAFFSPCLPNYDNILKYLKIMGFVAAPCVCLGLVIYLVKWYQTPQFVSLLSWVASLAWVFGVFSLYSDVYLLWKMQRYVLSEKASCGNVNERNYFLSFMPVNDVYTSTFVLGDIHCLNDTTVYLNPQGPFAPVDLKVEQQCDGFQYHVTFTQPPLTQSFSDFFQTLQRWYNVYGSDIFNGQSLSLDISAFSRLCQRFPLCHVVTVNNLPVCADQRDESQWSSKTHYDFLIVVVLVLTYKLTLEVSKLGIIIVSICHKRLWQPIWTIAFMRDSPCLILFPLSRLCSTYMYNPWSVLMQYNLVAADYWRLFVVNGVLNKAPMMGLTFWWIQKVSQVGFAWSDYFSLFSGGLALVVILLRGCYDVYQSRLSIKRLAAGADLGIPLQENDAFGRMGPRKTHLMYWNEVLEPNEHSLNSSFTSMSMPRAGVEQENVDHSGSYSLLEDDAQR